MADKKLRARDLWDGDLNILLSGAHIDNNGSKTASIEQWQYVLQLRILEELKTLNRLLACPNFTGIPQTLREIKRATNRIPTIAKPRKARAKK
jgi:hypothetical protein